MGSILSSNGPSDKPGTIHRENVVAFRARYPEGATTIADYLALLEADFQTVETTARSLAALTGPSYRKPYPQNLGSATTYSNSPETA